MAEHPTWTVSNRNPSITEEITTADGLPVDLTGATVQFQAREAGSGALLVDQPAAIVSPATAGLVRYDWSAADIAANGLLSEARQALVWWRVTAGGKAQDMGEAIINVVAHAPLTNTYVELETFKSTLELTGTTFTDQDARSALVSASRAVDHETGQRFYPDTDATQVRYYTATNGESLWIDPLIQLTSIVTDNDDNGVYENTWVLNTDFALEPANALLNGESYNTIRILSAGSFGWPSYPNRIKVTGKFGWTVAPEPIKTATSMIASRLLIRMRQAPLGVAGVGADGSAVRIARDDSDVAALIAPYMRRQLVY